MSRGFYVILLVLETWFVFRPYIVQQAQQRHGLLGWHLPRAVARVLRSVREGDALRPEMDLRAWPSSASPRAHGLHGYVGFMFGSLKSREWWSSDLMPAIFLFSAIISGTALLIVLYVVSCRLRRVPVDLACMKGHGVYAVGLRHVHPAAGGGGIRQPSSIKGREGIDMIWQFVTGPLVIPFFVLQFGIGAVLPILWLSYMFWRGTTGKALVVGITRKRHAWCCSRVLMMRFNVVIGGQEISKTGKGLLAFPWVFLGREGVLAATSVLVAPLLLLLVVIRLFPPWVDAAKASSH